jgi:hypothetical protein
LADTFGDGWGNALLHVYSQADVYNKTYAPTASNNEISFDKCFNARTYSDGNALIARLQGFNVAESWEV